MHEDEEGFTHESGFEFLTCNNSFSRARLRSSKEITLGVDISGQTGCFVVSCGQIVVRVWTTPFLSRITGHHSPMGQETAEQHCQIACPRGGTRREAERPR